MEGTAKMESHLSSAAAFVEGGIQDACDDSCSICLEAFCDSDPSTVTGCKHEFHLQCILEWCQRSSQCPMCWQPISLKDPTSQELLETVERERSIRACQTQNTAIFHHPALGDFELHHIPVGTTDSELEERIIQHLAAAAAMGRARHIGRREGQRVRSLAHEHPQFLVLSTNSNSPAVGGSVSTSSLQREQTELPAAITVTAPSPLIPPTGEDLPHASNISSGTSNGNANYSGLSNNRVSAGQSTPVTQDGAGSSDLHSFSESLKSRLNAISMRYKDSITKSTRGWKERLFSRHTSVSEIGSEVKREVSAGIATVSRMMERLDTRERRNSGSSSSQSPRAQSISEQTNGRTTENHTSALPTDSSTSTTCATSSGSN
ncbi:E3 ubiquitin-protein ligase RHF2A [Apostasia shenzhenica]|uniref:RING-type E3 ubiquitin transferase n=1 Tax=Apostasia shenzhenica TaxID=1088818 RepID=A0A2I0A9R0_9ASPA|nr:E3 ubiquitin-protein ligase RHF2A [Apostasia shenzhenica]